jgi:hypothetical protein
VRVGVAVTFVFDVDRALDVLALAVGAGAGAGDDSGVDWLAQPARTAMAKLVNVVFMLFILGPPTLEQ